MLNSAEMYASLPVVDLERAKEFYVSKLGLKVKMDPVPGLVVLLENEVGDQVMLYQRAQTKADHTVLSFNVDSIEKNVDELVQKGVVFEQYDLGNGVKTDEKGIATMNIPSVGTTKAAWFKDTEGNILSLNQKI